MRRKKSKGFRAIKSANSSAAAPTTTNPADYGTVAAWYDPTDGVGVGYTLSGSDVTQLTDQSGNARHLVPLVSAKPTIAQIGGKDGVLFTSTDRRLGYTGTSFGIEAFVVVFRPASNFTAATEGDFIFGHANESSGLHLGQGLSGTSFDQISSEIVGFRNGASTAVTAMDVTGYTVSSGTTYIIGGRWNGTDWEFYVNTNWNRANMVLGTSTITTTTFLTVGGKGQNSATVNPRGFDGNYLQGAYFSASVSSANLIAYMNALATYFSVTINTTALTAATLADKSISVNANPDTETSDVLAGATAGSGSITASTVWVTTQPTKGSVSVNGTTGVCTYTPDSGENDTTDTFKVRVRDSNGLPSSTGTTSVTIGAASAGSGAAYEGLGYGNAMVAMTPSPRKLDATGKTMAIVFRVPKDGTIDEVSFELASNNSPDEADDNEKSAGTGDKTVPIKVTRTKNTISGDGSNIIKRPDFSNILLTTSVEHNRGNQVSTWGDKRCWHTVTGVGASVTAGEYLAIVQYSEGTANDYVSNNNMSLVLQNGTGVDLDFNLTPPRKLGPYWKDSDASVLISNNHVASPSATDSQRTYRRDADLMAWFACTYADDSTWGTPVRYAINQGNAGPAAYVASDRSLRQSWRQTAPTFNTRYIWVWIFHESNNVPSADLTLTLRNETDSLSYTATVSTGSTPLVNTLPYLLSGSPSSKGDWVKFDLGAKRSITNGKDFRITLSTTGTGRYRTYPCQSNQQTSGYSMKTNGVAGAIKPSATNGWYSQYGSSSTTAPSEAEYGFNTTWNQFDFNFTGTGKAFLPIWMEAA